MQIISYIPSIYDIFTTIGGFATVYAAVAVAKRFIARWQAAGADKNARIEAMEQALRELAEALDKRKGETPDAAKGAVA